MLAIFGTFPYETGALFITLGKSLRHSIPTARGEAAQNTGLGNLDELEKKKKKKKVAQNLPKAEDIARMAIPCSDDPMASHQEAPGEAHA